MSIPSVTVFPVNDIGNPEELVAQGVPTSGYYPGQSASKRIWVVEVPDPDNIAAWTGPTTAWLFRPVDSDDYMYRPVGSSQEFTKGPYAPGQKIADIKTVAGSTFFAQFEE